MSPAPRARVQLEGLFRDALAAVDSRRAVERVLEGAGGKLAIAGRRLEPGARIWLLAVGLRTPVEFFPNIDPKNVYVNVDPAEGTDLA